MNFNEVAKLISLLLRYPDEEIYYTLNEIDLFDVDIPYIKEVLEFIQKNRLLDVQKEYVKSFDMNEKATLYLTYHRFKDDPKRGTYLAKLVEYYREKGFEFIENELPDFLPVVLEFVSFIDEETGIKILQNFEKEIEQIEKGLKDVNSAYTPLISFILSTLQSREVK